MIGNRVDRTDCFSRAPKTHCYHVGPCSPGDTGDNLPDEADGEYGEEEGVGAQGGVIAVDCGFDRTGGIDVDAEVCVGGTIGGPVRHGG